MSKEQYERVLPPLRDALLAAQKEMQDEKSFALAVIVTGTPTAGRSEIVNEFLEWLDPKHIRVHALTALREQSREFGLVVFNPGSPPTLVGMHGGFLSAMEAM